MDILAGMLAYVAGIGALFAALAVSFFVFFATPREPLQTETQPQNARAMLVRPSTPNKPAAEARAKRNATQSAGPSEKGAERHAAAAGSSLAAQATASARDPPAQTRRIHGSSAAAHPRRARAARPTSRTQALRAGSSVTPIEFRRNLQA
jgi:cytoskeletal protein RodZ